MVWYIVQGSYEMSIAGEFSEQARKIYVRNYLGRADPAFGQRDELDDPLRSFLVLFFMIL